MGYKKAEVFTGNDWDVVCGFVCVRERKGEGEGGRERE